VKQGDKMRISEITINCFRNIKKLKVDFGETNIVIGENAQGKTSLLEAIYVLCMLKTFKSQSEDDLITFGDRTYSIKGKINNSLVNKQLCVCYDVDEKKRNFIDNKRIKNTEYIGVINVTIMIPEDIYIISGESAERRRFLDSSIGQSDRKYLNTLSAYHRVLKQRNSLLKMIKENRYKISEISYWNDQMCNLSKEIVNKRESFLSEITNFVNLTYKYLNNSGEHLELAYKKSMLFEQSGQDENYEKSFENSIKRVLNEEIARGHSLLGAHRDDIQILINGKDAKKYGSLGQQRSGVISLRLAAHNYMREQKKDLPLLLVDDIFSELDTNRKAKFLELLNNESQLFITGTNKSDFDNYFENKRYIFIKNGDIFNEKKA
jgi:DNA replication and repair protein RecF